MTKELIFKLKSSYSKSCTFCFSNWFWFWLIVRKIFYLVIIYGSQPSRRHPQITTSWYFYHPIVFSHIKQRWLCNQKSMVKLMECAIQDWLMKDIKASVLLFLLIICFGRSQLPCRKKLRPPVKSLLSEPSWKQIIQFESSHQMTLALTTILTATSWETLRQNHPPTQSQISDWMTHCELIHFYCFKPLFWRRICYEKIDNYSAPIYKYVKM